MDNDHDGPLTGTNSTTGLLWDCGSSLYDSFELKSFKRQLDSAIVARSFSMPRLSDPARPPSHPIPKKPSFSVSRSIRRLIRSVFRQKAPSAMPAQAFAHAEGGCYGWRSSGVLATIPEACEKGVDSPDADPMVRMVVSERFTSATAAAAAASGGAVEVPCS